MCSCSHCMNLFHEGARSSIFHMNLTGDVFLDISLSSRQANSLAYSCVCVCVSVRQNRVWCANQNHLPHELCFANLLLTDLTFDLPRARFKQRMNGLCVCFCVWMCQFVWNYSTAVLLEVKLTPRFQTSERLPWWNTFAARTHPCKALHKMLPSL